LDRRFVELEDALFGVVAGRGDVDSIFFSRMRTFFIMVLLHLADRSALAALPPGLLSAPPPVLLPLYFNGVFDLD
jgi:hypothetical protein